MDNFTAQDWLLLIGGITSLITSTIAAFKSNRSAQVGHTNEKKLEELQGKTDTIQNHTDGAITEYKEKLLHADRVNEHLLEVVTCLVDQLPEGSLMKAKREVEKLKSEIGYRRSSDFHSNFSRENLLSPATRINVPTDSETKPENKKEE
jgi:hypothetical protein